ncbi:hypothetical protein [Coralloluteibacterium thermophilus]|uniref:Uncharacterized protein n=1 Tax=Coralloluteibacterium thermophilum TaxID=2707049 RepID=A0ABV9NKA3_9GAMM
MANFFDQFDQAPAAPVAPPRPVTSPPRAAANFFDQFDEGTPPPAAPAPASAAAPAPVEPPRSAIDNAGRGVGMLLRNVAEGGASLAGIVTDPAIALWNSATGRQDYGTRAGVSAALDAIGLPKPESGTERIAGDVVQAVTGGGGLIGAGRQMAARGANLIPAFSGAASDLRGIADAANLAPKLAAEAMAGRQLAASGPTALQGVGQEMAKFAGLQLAGNATGAAAGGAAREDGATPAGQIVAALAGGLAPSALTSGLPAATRGLLRGGESNRQALENAVQDFTALGGATPSVGQGTGSWMRQAVENSLGASPTAGGVMARFGQQQGDQIGEGLSSLARRMSSNPTAEGAGRSIRRGVDQFSTAVRARRGQLYDQVDQFVPPDTPVALTRTQQALASLTTPTAGAEATTGALVNPALRSLADNVSADLAAAQARGAAGLPYDAVKAIRSRIGEDAFSFTLAPDKPTAQLRQVYGALTRDMEDLAKQAGPEAERALRRANSYYRASQDRLELLERVVDKNGGPEAVFQAAMGGTREGATVLRSVMRSLPEDAQRDVTAAVIRRMGMATPGAQDAAGEVFSAQTFLTNWNRLSPEARSTLFNRYGPEMSADFDRIARVAGRIKEGSGVLRNPSGTGAAVAGMGYWGGLGLSILRGDLGSAALLGSGGAGMNVLARALTNPRTVRWLADATDMPVSALPQQLVVLRRIAEASNDPDVAALADALSGSEMPDQGDDDQR